MRLRIGIIGVILFAVSCYAAVAKTPEILLTTPRGVIRLSSYIWAKANDDTRYAYNYFEQKKSPWQYFARVVTVYVIPMSVDRRIGLKISDREYVEFFIVHPGYVTVHVSVDKGGYWVLCRETFNPKITSIVDISKYKPFMSDNENRALLNVYQNEIDETRQILNNDF